MARWFEQHRQAWIAEVLDVFGFINRVHLQRKFGLSQPQASLDLQRFQRAHPTAMVYDTSRKCYVQKPLRDRAARHAHARGTDALHRDLTPGLDGMSE